MWKAALAGAVMLATMGSLSVTPEGIAIGRAAAQELELTQAQLTQIKTVLHLRPTQEPHWRSVEDALRGFARQPSYRVADAGVTPARGKPPVSYRLDFMAMQQVAWAARPLIDSLDEMQKSDGVTTMRAMGIPSLF